MDSDSEDNVLDLNYSDKVCCGKIVNHQSVQLMCHY